MKFVRQALVVRSSSQLHRINVLISLLDRLSGWGQKLVGIIFAYKVHYGFVSVINQLLHLLQNYLGYQ